jgi:hypothetical protein
VYIATQHQGRAQGYLKAMSEQEINILVALSINTEESKMKSVVLTLMFCVMLAAAFNDRKSQERNSDCSYNPRLCGKRAWVSQ